MAVCPQCKRDVGYVRFCPYDGTPLAHLGRTTDPSELRPSDVVDGRYVIEQELGRGAMGVVYRARSVALKAPVAVKVLRPELAGSERSLGRFAREARASSRIDHPNVVKVFDFGFASEGFYFLVMELLEGHSLGEIMGDVGPMPAGRALNILVQIADGVSRAHELGVIHRDLKPENVVVHRRDGDRVTLVDFGLSKGIGGWEGGQLTREGTLLGTPEYMSPEQWLGKDVDGRTDIYAFGALAYELLCGELPLDGPTVVVKMQRHLKDRPVPLTERRLVLPEGLGALVMRCLAKDRDERPQTMGDVATTLRWIMEDAEAIEGTDRHEGGLPQMTELVLADLGALSAASLVDEIERLRRVRLHRLKEVLGSHDAGAPGWARPLLGEIERAEAALELEERERAICRARLDERRAERRQREASLRHALVEASLRMAVHRSGLPEDVPDWEPDTAPDVGSVEQELRDADHALAAFLARPDPVLTAAWDRHQAACRRVEADDVELQKLYDRLESELRERPDGRTIASTLTRIDGAIAAYRAQLSRARTRAREPHQ